MEDLQSQVRHFERRITEKVEDPERQQSRNSSFLKCYVAPIRTRLEDLPSKVERLEGHIARELQIPERQKIAIWISFHIMLPRFRMS